MKELRQKRENRRIYRWAAVCAACMMFLAAGMPAWAARTGNVRVNDVNVRTEASSDSNRVCKLPINTTVTIADQAEGSDGKLWYSVTFTLDGAQKAGWIRSDMLTVSEEETPEGAAPAEGQSDSYSIREPEEAYPASDVLVQTSVSVGEESFTAWQVDTERTGGSELYLVYASKADGSSGWFYYDPADGTFQRDMGQFAGGGEEPEGLIQALQKELSDLKASSAKELGMRLYIIIGLGVLCVILLILTIVFGLKYRNAAYEYVDDEDEDDEDGAEEEITEKKKGFFGHSKDEEEEEDDFDDFFAAAQKKKGCEEELTEDELTEDEPRDELTEDEPQEEATEEFPEEELPEIDMSAVLEIEEAEQKESDEEDDGLEDFDIEILDWEDLNL